MGTVVKKKRPRDNKTLIPKGFSFEGVRALLNSEMSNVEISKTLRITPQHFYRLLKEYEIERGVAPKKDSKPNKMNKFTVKELASFIVDYACEGDFDEDWDASVLMLKETWEYVKTQCQKRKRKKNEKDIDFFELLKSEIISLIIQSAPSMRPLIRKRINELFVVPPPDDYEGEDDE